MIIILLILGGMKLNAQLLFLNSNNEVCVELYTVQDPMQEFVVCMVIETLTPKDSSVLRKWSTYNTETRSRWTGMWANYGYRIEAVYLPLDYLPNHKQHFKK